MPTQTFDHTLFFPNGDHEVPARIEKPVTATPDNPVPAVVILHGTGTQKDEVAGSYKRLARLLAREGITSIRIDFLGHGESAGHEKDFNFTNARADIEQTVQACKNPDSRMYVIQGGDHTFRTLTRDTRVFYQAADATIKWLRETL